MGIKYNCQIVLVEKKHERKEPELKKTIINIADTLSSGFLNDPSTKQH